MFGLPESTEIRKPLPKTILYGKYPTELTGNRKKSFENDISRILVVNEISSASVNIREGDEVRAIFAVLIELKKKNYNEKNIALIAKLLGQRLLIILHYQNEYQLAIYQTKVLCSEWFDDEKKTLRLDGLTLDNVWQNLVSQISGVVPQKERTLDEQIEHEDEKEKLKKQIEKLETQAKQELQSKKKYELHERILNYKRILEDM